MWLGLVVQAEEKFTFTWVLHLLASRNWRPTCSATIHGFPEKINMSVVSVLKKEAAFYWGRGEGAKKGNVQFYFQPPTCYFTLLPLLYTVTESAVGIWHFITDTRSKWTHSPVEILKECGSIMGGYGWIWCEWVNTAKFPWPVEGLSVDSTIIN